MRFLPRILTVLISLSFLTTTVFAQSQLKKANKEYDLAAYNLAINSYLKVLKKDPNNSLAMARLADSYRYLNDMNEAERWYAKAIKLSNVDPSHLFEYAKVLKTQKKYTKAKEWFDIYGEGRPDIGKHFKTSCDFAASISDVPSLYTLENASINTINSDFSPVVYNKQLVFASARQDISRGGKDWAGGSKNQLFIADLGQGSRLGQPQHLHAEVKASYNEGPISYSLDGRTVAFTKNTFIDGTRQIPGNGMEMSIYIADVTVDGDWNEAKPFPFNGSGYSSGYPHLSADGKTLYFASNRPDGFGGYDIYVSRKTGDTWSTPENMGPVINSKGNEITPFITDNGQLVFASDWHHGLGGFDLFRAEKVGSAWKNVFHLGNGINSTYDDYGYVYDEMKGSGYIVSNRPGGKGNEDIYKITKATKFIVIQVKDKKTKRPISNALVDFSACGEPVFKTDANGIYKFQALEGLDCDLTVSKDGYTSSSLDLNGQGNGGKFIVELGSQSTEKDYQGKVVHVSKGTGVGNVRILAMAQSSGLNIETTSDANGTYYLPLEANETYIIRYSKVGFSDTKKQIRTGQTINNLVLGVVSIPPAGTNIVDNSPINSSTVISSTPQNNGGTREVVDVVTETTTVTVPAPPAENTGVEMIGQKGYAVQISAIKLGNPIVREKYKVMTSVGNVYGRAIDGYTKVRIGIFATRGEAKAAAQAAKSNGFGSAFIVAEEIRNTNEMEIFGYKSAGSYNASPSSVPASNTTANPTGYTNGNYKVQIGAYKDMKYFDRETASRLGIIEERSNGNLTVVVLGGFLDKSAARKARSQAIRAGFKGAFVVYDNGTSLEKVK